MPYIFWGKIQSGLTGISSQAAVCFCGNSALAAAGVSLLAAGFALGRLTAPVTATPLPPEPPAVQETLLAARGSAPPTQTSAPSAQQNSPLASEAYNFKEPLIEQAARLMLKKGDGGPVTYGELEEITEIFIYGKEIVNEQENPEWWEDRPPVTPGSIKSLEDFRGMKNLRKLRLYSQPFSEISPLAECLQLEHINVSSCNVSDLSSLAGLPLLSRVDIGDTFVTDYSIFARIGSLRQLCIHNAEIARVSDLGDLPGLETLELPGGTLDSLDGIERMPWLQQLNIAHTSVTDFSLLNDRNALPRFRQLAVGAGMERYLNTLDRDDVEITVF